MKVTPPVLRLTARMAETPAVFSDVKTVVLPALVSDLYMDAGGGLLPPEQLERFAPARIKGPGHKGLLLLACHLLHDEVFLTAGNLAPRMLDFLASPGVEQLAALVKPELFIRDPERREELVRLALAALDLLPEGETAALAKDRLATLDSVERDRLIRKTRRAKERARKLREEMARRRAAEAASKMSRE